MQEFDRPKCRCRSQQTKDDVNVRHSNPRCPYYWCGQDPAADRPEQEGEDDGE